MYLEIQFANIRSFCVKMGFNFLIRFITIFHFFFPPFFIFFLSVYNFLFSDHKVCIIIFKCCGSKVCIADQKIVSFVRKSALSIFHELFGLCIQKIQYTPNKKIKKIICIKMVFRVYQFARLEICNFIKFKTL